MAPPKHGGRKENSESPSNNLWVGNLSQQVSDYELMNLFSRHGQVDSVASYPSRSYAFVYYRHVEHAKMAIKALRGTLVRGSPLKIEFAKPAKPCKSLWVSGVGQAVTKEMLEEEFIKFGKIEEFRFIRDRNTAYVDFVRLEDAARALKNMKGKRIGGDQIHVDFLRSQPLRRDQLGDHHDSREGQFLSQGMGHIDTPFMQHEAVRSYYEPTYPGPQRQQFHSFEGQRGDGPPTNVLLICYPTNIEIDEHMLHNAMILFGEIESLKSFPSRHCAFVEFRSMDEARRAKEGLQGRLFNDPRITIMYSSNELAPGKVYPELHAGMKGPRPNTYNELPFQPAHMDISNAPNAFSGYSPSGRNHGPMRPFIPPGSLAGPEFKDSTRPHNIQDANDKSILGTPSWRRTSPAPEVLPSPSLGIKRPTRPLSAPWDVPDDQLRGESKRLRASQDVDTGGTSQGYLDKDYIWRGLIAKGGNPVCRARCVPIGKGIESEIPEVVNCSARTGLDMLSKHYADAIGFDIVFFLPDCEEDFASYTEFLNYLGGKDRAGVARFNNGTTLFLVPPSDFLTKVLKITGPPRLYGVVLKFPQDPPGSNPAESQPLPTSHYMNKLPRHYQGEYIGIPPKKETQLASAPKITTQSVAAVTTVPVSQAGVTLTPELIATLASFLPASSKSSGPLTAPLPPVGPSSRPFAASYEFSEGPPQGWASDRKDPDQTAYHLQQGQEQYNPQQQVAQHQNYTTGLSMPYNTVHGVSVNNHVQDPPYYLPPPGEVSRPLSSFDINSQSGQQANTAQFNQRHQNEVAQSASYGFGMAQGSSSLGPYGSSVYPQVSKSGTLPSFVHGSDIQHAQASMLSSADKENPEPVNNIQQLQIVNCVPSQETAGVEVDKNQRYQSTLQFAANLLLQIQQQQQQQQTGSKSGQGSGNKN